MLGQNIKSARKNKGLTLVQLGRLVGLTHASLSQIENGITNPSKRTVISLAKALNSDFGEAWLREHLEETPESSQNEKQLAEKLSVKEFVSLKFGGKTGRRSRAEIDALTTLLDAEIERMKKEQEEE